jgi:hypothetical protein
MNTLSQSSVIKKPIEKCLNHMFIPRETCNLHPAHHHRGRAAYERVDRSVQGKEAIAPSSPNRVPLFATCLSKLKD